MRLVVVHDSKGKIVSVTRVEPEAKGRVQAAAGLTPRRGQKVLELDAAGELSYKALSEIHQAFRVDVKAKKLVARPGKGSQAQR